MRDVQIHRNQFCSSFVERETRIPYETQPTCVEALVKFHPDDLQLISCDHLDGFVDTFLQLIQGHSKIHTLPQKRINKSIQTIQNVWMEIDQRLDTCRAKRGVNIECLGHLFNEIWLISVNLDISHMKLCQFLYKQTPNSIDYELNTSCYDYLKPRSVFVGLRSVE